MNKFTKSSCVLLTNKEKLENRNTTCFWKESKTCEKTMDKFKNIYTLKSRKKKTNKYTMTTEQDSKVWTLSTNWPTDSSNPNQNHNWLLGYKSINLFQNGNMYKESRTAKTFLKKTKFGWLVLGHQDFLKKKKKKIEDMRGRREDRGQNRTQSWAADLCRHGHCDSGTKTSERESVRGRSDAHADGTVHPEEGASPAPHDSSTAHHRPKCEATKHTQQNIRGDYCELSLRIYFSDRRLGVQTIQEKKFLLLKWCR